ncbi:MAG: thiamine phosphate synthase [Deltaproteobacteria bacterium]|nr:thiamine phosphate synthase [Deltaproteobacteria bacterium]
MRSPNFDLYLVTDRNQTGGRDLLWVLERALEGGVRAVQLREKDLGGRELFVLAEKTKRLCERYQANFFVNDRVDVALGVDAEGVHLGGDSMPVRAARELLGAEKLIGVSTHSIKEAREEAEQEKADFIFFGPVYFTPSKAAYGEPQGLGRLKEVVEKISLPVYAIGGVKVGNIAEVKETGVRGIALISAILSAVDPRGAAQEILKAWERRL